jgi:hypothetical protein
MSDDPAIGLRMATLKLHHPPNMAAQHARTFGDALLDLARSSILSFSEEMRIVKTTNECSIEFTGAMLNESLEKTSAMLAACSRKTGTMSLQSANRFQQFIRVAFTAVWTKTGRLWRCRVYCLQYPGQEKLSALDQAKIINRTREIHYDDRLH